MKDIQLYLAYLSHVTRFYMPLLDLERKSYRGAVPVNNL